MTQPSDPLPADACLAAALDRARTLAAADGRDEVTIDDVLLCASRPGARPEGPARITPYRDGPYLLRGAFVITDQNGAEIEGARSTVALCRCGRSRIRPFCDGTHKVVGFEAPSQAEPPPR